MKARRNPVDRALDEIHKARIAGLRAGTWPTHTLGEWSALAQEAKGRARIGQPLLRHHERALEVVAVIGGDH